MFKLGPRSHRSVSSPSALTGPAGARPARVESQNSDGSVGADAHGQKSAQNGVDGGQSHENGKGAAQSLLAKGLRQAPRLAALFTSRRSPGSGAAGVMAAEGARPRSASAPALTGYVGPRLGAINHATASATTKQLLAKLLHAQTLIAAGQSTYAAQIDAAFDVGAARRALLYRELPQNGSIDALHATPIERVLESILAEELIAHMPPQMLLPMQHLAQGMATTLADMDSAASDKLMHSIVQDLVKEFPRPWSTKQPIMALLCSGTESVEHKKEQLLNFLRKPIEHGMDGLTAMVLLRSVYVGSKPTASAKAIVPWMDKADANYGKNILMRKPYKQRLGPPMPRSSDAVVGITNLGQASPTQVRDLVPGLRATHREEMDLASADVQEAIAYANPVASGWSGTTNMFLHAVSHHNGLAGAAHIEAEPLVALLAALTCFDGGHSVHEVLVVANMLHALPNLNLDTLATYTSGHARGIFVEMASRAGAQNLAATAFDRLEQHFQNHALPEV